MRQNAYGKVKVQYFQEEVVASLGYEKPPLLCEVETRESRGQNEGSLQILKT
jgi:hypothetical protein